ncbi:MAG: aspartate-semialdehyde dehydrogenase [Anaerolineae bacterium]|nr:MAG: aspartate-semialdehyde dehydrogenase [Anaerolineae bacterium]
MTEKIPVAVLGATGTVGQRFISLLADHPWFEIVSITGSERSEGREYGEVVRWLLPGEIPPTVREMQVNHNDGKLQGAQLVFSALPARVAKDAEPRLAAEGYIVCSNASAHRMGGDIPLLIPEINADHLALIDHQRDLRGWPGLVVTSPNCATTGIVFPLKALDDAFGVSHVHAVTMQAISGAGYPGVASIEIYDNVIPHIQGEEVKIEQETRKLLGELGDHGIEPADIKVSAQANRVPVLDGHLAALSVGLRKDPDLNEVEAALAAFRGVDELPSAPAHPLIVRSEQNRPQPRLDRQAQDGMAVSVGRVQPCSVLDYRMITLVHNTLRGAAGGALLNAELLVVEGYLGESAKEAAFA